jgi:hypothetical protein
MARHYNIKLFKIASIHDRVRTDTMLGVAKKLPELGEDFLMFGKGLEFGTRMLRTTPITASCRIDDTILFRTKNSTYVALVIDEFDDEADNPSLTTNQGGS